MGLLRSRNTEPSFSSGQKIFRATRLARRAPGSFSWFMMRRFIRVLLWLAAVTLAGCSTFDRRYAAISHADAKGDRFSGAYEGQWMSSSHPGGAGKLWCILQKQRDTTYLAEFRATWHGIFSSEHSVVLHTRNARAGGGSSAGSRTFTGSAALKTLIGAGTYRCEGTVDGTRMRACYDATYDRGTFDLKRVPPGTAGAE